MKFFHLQDTDGSDINERPLIAGHHGPKNQITALACNPKVDEYTTGAQDGTLRVWSVSKLKLLRLAKMDGAVMCVSYSPDRQRLAVALEPRSGIDAGSADKKAGTLMIVTEDDLSVIHETQDAGKALTKLAYSPDGTTLATASADTNIYVYSAVDDTYELLCKCEAHTSPIRNLDFDVSGEHLQSTSFQVGRGSDDDSDALLYHGTIDGVQEKNRSELQDVEWATWTCTEGWPVQALAASADLKSSQINSVDRSHDGQKLAMGDALGRVRMYHYPIPEKGFRFSDSRGHCDAVNEVRFTVADSHLITVGGLEDKTIFQWRVVEDAVGNTADPDDGDVAASAAAEAKSASEEADGPEEHQLNTRGRSETFSVATCENNFFEMKELPHREAKKKPWELASHAPGEPKKIDPLEPGDDMTLDWIHGYSASISRNNLWYTADKGCIVYPAAGVGVLYNIPKHAQVRITFHVFTQTHRDRHSRRSECELKANPKHQP